MTLSIFPLVPLTGGGFSPLPIEWLREHGEELADLVDCLKAAKTQTLPSSGQLSLLELCDSTKIKRPEHAPDIEQ